MIKLNKKLIAALLFPLISLMALTVYKGLKIAWGTSIIIPIAGYDPRDLLSGHYLTYSLDLGSNTICSGDYDQEEEVLLCLNQNDDDTVTAEKINYYDREDMAGRCTVILEGTCKGWRFTAGIERFYIPEEHSRILDRVIRQGKGSIVVKVDSRGNAVIKDLLINGKSWKSYIKENTKE